MLSTLATAEHVFNVVVRAEKLSSLSELNESFQQVLGPLGLHLFACAHIHQNDDCCDLEILFGHGAGPWLRHYRQMQFAQDDPVIKRAARSSDPFFLERAFKEKTSLRA